MLSLHFLVRVELTILPFHLFVQRKKTSYTMSFKNKNKEQNESAQKAAKMAAAEAAAAEGVAGLGPLRTHFTHKEVEHDTTLWFVSSGFGLSFSASQHLELWFLFGAVHSGVSSHVSTSKTNLAWLATVHVVDFHWRALLGWDRCAPISQTRRWNTTPAQVVEWHPGTSYRCKSSKL